MAFSAIAGAVAVFATLYLKEGFILILRPYQQKFIDDVNNEFDKGVKRVCGVAPCGAGKTVMAAAIVKSAIDNGQHVIFFVHRKELIDQTANTFCRFGIPFSIISAGNKPNYNLPVQIASVQTLVNRLNYIHTPDLLICDECHHILADSYLKIVKRFGSNLLGITATPQRMGGVNLGDVFQSLVLAPSVRELITLGNLVDFKYFSSSLNLKTDNLHIQRGDFVNDELFDLMNNQNVIADTVHNYKKFADGKSAICYCVNIKHSLNVADKFNAAGIPAAHVDGDTDKALRAKIVNDFKQGRFKILCNVDLFGEGFDVPNMDAVILARPTKSLTLFIQQSMRPMRPDPNNPNKVATIIDCANNFKRFGLPDFNRNWSLAPNTEKEKGEAPVKICPDCDEVVPLGTKICKCGYEFFDNSVVEDNKTLIEIPRGFQAYLILAEKNNYKKYWAVLQFINNEAKSYQELLQVAQYMGYQKGWAWYKWQEIKNSRS